MSARSQSLSAAHQAEIFLGKQNGNLESVKTMHVMNKNFAKQLSSNGEISVALANSGMSQDDIDSFLAEKKAHIREMTVQHLKLECTINATGDALLQIKNDLQRGNGTSNSGEKQGEENPEEETIDYEKKIMQHVEILMKKPKHQPKTNHKFKRDISDALGDKKDDEDEDLIMTNATNNLNCPITGSLLVMPMRNKLCGHTYSKAGVDHLLRTGGRCPIPGCIIRQIHSSQLEKDIEMEREVKKFLRKKEHAKTMRLTQSENVEDDDDDDLVVTGRYSNSNKMTVIE